MEIKLEGIAAKALSEPNLVFTSIAHHVTKTRIITEDKMDKTKKIVVIMTDSQRWDMVGCYSNNGLKTPYIDKLAAEGLKFNRAYTTQPVCGPARSALFTGLYPHSNGSWSNCMPLGDNVKTIGQRLRDNGFHTAYIGKWHLDGGDYFGLGRCPDGWDDKYWYDMRNYLEELTEEERVISRTPKTMEKQGVKEEFTFGHRCSNRAIDFLKNYSKEDFFLTVSYDEPHDPYLCPEPYASMYKDYEFPKCENVWDNLENKPEHHKVWAGDSLKQDKDSLRIKNQYFFGANSFIDYEIGRVLEAVEKYAPDAIVIYTSDHGDFLSSHSLWAKGPSTYDEITRIPFIVKWPGVVEPGTTCEKPVSHINIVPTILDASGLNIPKILEGKSICTTLKNPEVNTGNIYMEFSRYEVDHDGFGGFQPLRSVFDGRYKLTINLLVKDELYDLENDPHELNNIIDSEKYITIRNQLHDNLLEWMNRTRDPFRGYYWANRPWRDYSEVVTWDYMRMTRQRENEEYEPRQLDYKTGLKIKEAVRFKVK